MKPENVVGALVYTDGNGHWWGDVVLRKGGKCHVMGTPEKAPLQSYDHALGCVKDLIANGQKFHDSNEGNPCAAASRILASRVVR